MIATSLITNQSIGHQPEFAPCHTFTRSNGACQPPRNNVVANAETVTMLMYSARKNIANLSEEYSVWKPPTSSDSASGRSNGARLVSPTMEMQKITKLGTSNQAYQPPCWALTIPAVDSVPA